MFFIMCLFFHFFTESRVTFLTLFLSTAKYLYSATKEVGSLSAVYSNRFIVLYKTMLRRVVWICKESGKYRSLAVNQLSWNLQPLEFGDKV